MMSMFKIKSRRSKTWIETSFKMKNISNSWYKSSSRTSADDCLGINNLICYKTKPEWYYFLNEEVKNCWRCEATFIRDFKLINHKNQSQIKSNIKTNHILKNFNCERFLIPENECLRNSFTSHFFFSTVFKKVKRLCN